MAEHEIQSVDYALTLTCKPILYARTIEEQFDLAEVEIKDRLNKIKGYKSFFTIIAELTRSYNIHFHGVIRLKGYALRPINFLRKFYDAFRGSKIIGHVFFKPIENFHDWKQYMTKDVAFTYSNLDCRHPVIQNDYEINYELLDENSLTIDED